MSRYCILSLDLNKDITSQQRTTFYEALKEKQWFKIETTTTLWYASWKDGVVDADAISTTKSDVEYAATKAAVKSYDATFAVCGKPVSWSKKA